MSVCLPTSGLSVSPLATVVERDSARLGDAAADLLSVLGMNLRYRMRSKIDVQQVAHDMAIVDLNESHDPPTTWYCS